MPRASSLVLVFLLVSSALLAFAPSVSAASVTPQAAKLPEAMVGASAATVDGKTYVIGGRNAEGVYSERVFVYDAAADTLSALPERLPESLGGDAGGSPGRYSGTAVAVGSTIYYFGGAQLVEADISRPPDGVNEKIPKASRDVIAIDTQTGSVRMLNDKLPEGRWGMSSVVVAGKVYLFGGFTFDITDLAATGRHDTVLRFDPSLPAPVSVSSSRFRELDSRLSYTVQDSAAALVGSRVLIMGGLSDHNNDTNPCPSYTYYDSETESDQTRQIEVCITKRIMSFDPELEVVLGVAGELPYRAQFVSAATVQNKAYVAGALLSDGSSSSSILEVTNDAGTLRTRVLTPSLPRGAFGQAVATDGKTIVLAGGRFGSDRDLSDEIIRVDPRITPPWAPRSATAVDVAGGVRLSWEAPSYHGDGTITGYRIYRSAAGEAESKVGDVTGLTFDDRSVRPGTEYVWRIVAVNAVGESATSARVTRSSGIATPGVVASFEAFPGDEEVYMRWRPPTQTGGSNLSGYRILRNDQIIASLPPDANEHRDQTVTNGQTYLYQVRAYNAKGDGALSEPQRVTPALVPPAPANLNAEVVSEGSGTAVRVSWFAAEAVDRYVVYRSARTGVLGTPVANVTSTTYIDSVVERGQTYFYTVVSENDVGRSPPSSEQSVSLVRKPGAPTDVLAFGQEGEIRVSWAAPVDTGDAPAGLLRYYVSRSTGSGSASIVKTDIETTLFVDRFVTPGVTYAYTVTTLNPMSSDPSEAARASAQPIVNKPPFAVLAANPSFALAGEPVSIDASNSADPDGTIRSYLFDFGDGTDPVTIEAASLSHQYAVNGTYNATVIVTDDRGASTLAYKEVVVGETVTDAPPETGDIKPPARSTAGPGSETPGVPGPAPALVLAAVGAMALLLRRRRA